MRHVYRSSFPGIYLQDGSILLYLKRYTRGNTEFSHILYVYPDRLDPGDDSPHCL